MGVDCKIRLKKELWITATILFVDVFKVGYDRQVNFEMGVNHSREKQSGRVKIDR